MCCTCIKYYLIYYRRIYAGRILEYYRHNNNNIMYLCVKDINRFWCFLNDYYLFVISMLYVDIITYYIII